LESYGVKFNEEEVKMYRNMDKPGCFCEISPNLAYDGEGLKEYIEKKGL